MIFLKCVKGEVGRTATIRSHKSRKPFCGRLRPRICEPFSWLPTRIRSRYDAHARTQLLRFCNDKCVHSCSLFLNHNFAIPLQSMCLDVQTWCMMCDSVQQYNGQCRICNGYCAHVASLLVVFNIVWWSLYGCHCFAIDVCIRILGYRIRYTWTMMEKKGICFLGILL